MDNNHVLIISTGNQDIKILCKKTADGDGSLAPAEISNKGRRKFHEHLLQNNDAFTLVDSVDTINAVIADDLQITDMNWSKQRSEFLFPEKDKPGCLETKTNKGVSFTPIKTDKGYAMFPAKLHSIVKDIDEKKFNISAVLVFYTAREKIPDEKKAVMDKAVYESLENDYNSEPIAVGKIIAKWLADKFGLELNPIDGANFNDYSVCYVNFLKGLYAFEGNHIIETRNDSVYDQPLALQAIHMIDSATADLAANYNSKDTRAIVSHTGGIADAKAVITPVARLHFNGNITELHDSKYMSKSLALPEQDQRILPRNAILDAKHHATQRLWEGDFAGAWAVVSHIPSSDPDLRNDPWVEKIRQAANYFEGFAEIDKSCFPDSMTGGLMPLVRSAFKLEAALQNNSGEPLITEAVKAIVNFYDVSKQELIYFFLEKDGLAEIDRSQRLLTLKDDNDPRILRAIKEKLKKVDNQSCYRLNTRDQSMGSLLKIIATEKYDPLNCLDSIIGTPFSGKDPVNLRHFRNTATHYSLSSEDIDKIKCYARRTKKSKKKPLWNIEKNRLDRSKIGQCFLNTPWSKNIFALFDQQIDCEQLYRDYFIALLDEIHKPIEAGIQ